MHSGRVAVLPVEVSAPALVATRYIHPGSFIPQMIGLGPGRVIVAPIKLGSTIRLNCGRPSVVRDDFFCFLVREGVGGRFCGRMAR